MSFIDSSPEALGSSIFFNSIWFINHQKTLQRQFYYITFIFFLFFNPWQDQENAYLKLHAGRVGSIFETTYGCTLSLNLCNNIRM